MPEETTSEAEAEQGKTFTQAELDRIVADRLKREQSKYADYVDVKAKAEKFDEVEAASKSEAEKLAEKLAAAEKRASDAERNALRLEVATAKGLTPAQAKRLVGTTKEELDADADDLLATFKPAAEATGENTDDGADDGRPSPTNRPTPSLRGGGDPTQEPEPDIRAVVDAIPRGF